VCVCVWCITISLSICSSMDFSYFHTLTTANKAIMHVEMQIFLLGGIFLSFGNIPRRRNDESYGISIFSFLRNHHTIFYNGCTSLHFHQQCTSIASTHTLANLILVFLMKDILTGVRWYLILIWICISLNSDVEHLSVYLLAIFISSLENYLLRSSFIFNWLLFYLFLYCVI
jgi:hypothetical protein